MAYESSSLITSPPLIFPPFHVFFCTLQHRTSVLQETLPDTVFFVMACHCSCPGATKKFLISYPSPIPYCTALYDISLTNIILPQIIRLFHQSPDIFHLKLTHFICVQNVFLQIICKTKYLVAVCSFVQFRFTVS